MSTPCLTIRIKVAWAKEITYSRFSVAKSKAERLQQSFEVGGSHLNLYSETKVKYLLAVLSLVPAFALAESRSNTRVEVPSVVRFHCVPDDLQALAFGGTSMSAYGTVWIDKNGFENHQISPTASVQQTRVRARISYNLKGKPPVRDLNVTGNLRIWKNYPGQPQISLHLNPGSIQVTVGELVGESGKQPGVGHVSTMAPMICHNQLF